MQLPSRALRQRARRCHKLVSYLVSWTERWSERFLSLSTRLASCGRDDSFIHAPSWHDKSTLSGDTARRAVPRRFYDPGQYLSSSYRSHHSQMPSPLPFDVEMRYFHAKATLNCWHPAFRRCRGARFLWPFRGVLNSMLDRPTHGVRLASF